MAYRVDEATKTQTHRMGDSVAKAHCTQIFGAKGFDHQRIAALVIGQRQIDRATRKGRLRRRFGHADLFARGLQRGSTPAVKQGVRQGGVEKIVFACHGIPLSVIPCISPQMRRGQWPVSEA